MSISVEPAPAIDLVTPVMWPGVNRTARILVALTAERTAPRALHEADAFARRIGAELHLVRVVPHADPGVQGPPRDLTEAIRDAQRVLAAARRTRKLADRMLPERLPATRICVRLGAFVDQVAQRASELNALISVVPPGTRYLVPVVTELARRTARPVLVPKGCAPIGTLLAATDLEDSHLPVLRQAAELARDLGADVVALHNLLHGSAVPVPHATLEQCQLKLEQATRRLEGRLEPIVTRAPDPVQGILEQANAHDADLIVVGARARSDRVLFGTAAQLVRRAGRSVLVAPLEARRDSLQVITTS